MNGTPPISSPTLYHLYCFKWLLNTGCDKNSPLGTITAHTECNGPL